MLKNILKPLVKWLIILIVIIEYSSRALAQESDFYAQYFQNRYVTNPAMAGFEKGFAFNLGYQQPFTSVPGSLKAQYFTATYGANNNVGIGLNVYNESVGLITDTRVVGTYAYHLPLNEENRLNFGLSLGFNNTYINYNNIVGNQGDISVNRYNQQPLYIDGDFGTSFTSNNLTVQAMLPNLKSLFFRGNGQYLQTDLSVFLTTVSYKVVPESGNGSYALEPLAACRAIRGAAAIFSGGLGFEMPDYGISLSGMYRNNQSAVVSFGLGINNISFLLVYNNDFAALKTAENNTFEIGLKLRLFSKSSGSVFNPANLR